ncbi:MAG: hypothetical protein U0V74_06390 [Chitinophagales bacterium]
MIDQFLKFLLVAVIFVIVGLLYVTIFQLKHEKELALLESCNTSSKILMVTITHREGCTDSLTIYEHDEIVKFFNCICNSEPVVLSTRKDHYYYYKIKIYFKNSEVLTCIGAIDGPDTYVKYYSDQTNGVNIMNNTAPGLREYLENVPVCK